MKTTHALQQGSDAWHQFRLQHFGASEAAAMLGLSPKMSRTELLRMKHTGLAREFSDWLQANVLDSGHEVEALARPHMERLVGEDLYQVTLSDGRISASCDGLTMLEDIAAEHKKWNKVIGPMVAAGQIPEEHMPQCQQVLMVTGAERLLFMVSDGTPENMAHQWVFPDEAWFQRLRDGWAQFERDLATYELPPATEAAPVGKAPDSLPALRIEVTGQVTASNLAEFRETALTAIRSVNRSLTTDADFADAEKAVKWCADVETRIKAAKEHALSQTASIDALFKTLDDIAEESKRVRLDLGKVVDRRKVEVKEHAVAAARKALDLHIAVVNSEIAPMALRPVPVDFAGAIKGLRSIASMQDALDTALAAAKITADTQGRAIRANVAAFNALALADDYGFLFADLHQLVHKAADDFGAVVRSRIAEHKQAEAAKEAKRQADEAARIAQAEQRAREQEAARIAAEQAEDARVAALALQREQNAAAESARIASAALAQAAKIDTPAQHPQQVLKAEPATADATDRGPAAIVSPRVGAMGAGQAADAAPAVAKRDEPATLTLGMICERLQITVRADFVADVLHVSPAKVEGRRPGTYTESQFATICRQLVAHIGAMGELYSGVEA